MDQGTFRAAAVVLCAAGLAACGASGPVAPTPAMPQPQPVASPPPRSAVTFSVQSGAEGLRPLAGATVRVGDRTVTTGADGTAALDDVALPAAFEIVAPGFLTFRSLTTTPASSVVLWPIQPGMNGRWIFLTSYYGPDYNPTLWRPERDIELDLRGALAEAPYRPVWDAALRDVTSVIDSAGTAGPTVRLGPGPGAVSVMLVEAPNCHAVRWPLSPGILTPPPEIRFASALDARTPVRVLDVLTGLLGFRLRAGRTPGDVAGTLSPFERTALRMRLLRPPGTALIDESTEDTGAGTAESTDGYLCL